MTFDPVHDHGDRPYQWTSALSDRRASLTPDAPAVTDLHRERTWTYAELDGRANRTARLLRDAGVTADDRIAVIAQNRIEVIDLFHGVSKCGGVLAPISHRLAPPTIAELLSLVDPQLLIIEDRFTDLLEAASLDCSVIRLIDETSTTPAYPHYAEVLPADDAPVTTIERALSDPILLLHTGGTTGTPKEVVITYGSMLWNSMNTITGWGLRPDDVTPMVFPFFHTGGWNVLTIPFFHQGGHILIDRSVEPGAILESIETYEATILVAVPTVLRTMVDHEMFGSTDLSTIRLVKSGGGPCREDVINSWQDRGVDISQGYGLTECGPNNFGMPPEADRPDSVGTAMPHVDVRVVAGDEEAAINEIGELELASPHAADRYFRNEAESAEVFGGGWVSTGDLARIDADGFVYIEGRKKHMFVSGGENVYPAEVEVAIAEHPAVEEVVVIGVSDEQWGEVGLAIVESSEPIELDDLRAFLDGRLARFMHPRHLRTIETMPTSGPDKIDREALRERFVGSNR